MSTAARTRIVSRCGLHRQCHLFVSQWHQRAQRTMCSYEGAVPSQWSVCVQKDSCGQVACSRAQRFRQVLSVGQVKAQQMASKTRVAASPTMSSTAWVPAFAAGVPILLGPTQRRTRVGCEIRNHLFEALSEGRPRQAPEVLVLAQVPACAQCFEAGHQYHKNGPPFQSGTADG